MRALLKPFLGIVLAASFAGFVASAQAVPISGTGTQTSFTGDFDFDAIDDMLGTLTITLNNTTPAAAEGFLTAFVFNNPDDKITARVYFHNQPELHAHIWQQYANRQSVRGF